MTQIFAAVAISASIVTFCSIIWLGGYRRGLAKGWQEAEEWIVDLDASVEQARQELLAERKP